MVTAYDYRPEISNNNNKEKIESYNKGQMDFLKNKIFLENKDKKQEDKNEFMDLTMKELYKKIMNLLPTLYNDYHKKYLETSLQLKKDDEYISENDIVRKTLMSFIFNNKNMVYLGIVIMFISFLLYMINL